MSRKDGYHDEVRPRLSRVLCTYAAVTGSVLFTAVLHFRCC